MATTLTAKFALAFTCAYTVWSHGYIAEQQTGRHRSEFPLYCGSLLGVFESVTPSPTSVVRLNGGENGLISQFGSWLGRNRSVDISRKIIMGYIDFGVPGIHSSRRHIGGRGRERALSACVRASPQP